MARVVRIHDFGGPERLVEESVPDVAPAAGEVRIRQTAIGVNFTEVHGRRGDYGDLRGQAMPLAMGMEAVGVVEALGPGVTRFKAGDRVAYAARPLGSYADVRNFPAAKCVRVPEGIDDVALGASLLKGLTIEYLIRRVHRVEAGQWVVFHAAAGGVGTLAGQWLKALGARAIGIVGSPAKAAIARASGYEHVFVDGLEDWTARVRELTGGRGVPVVYDSVGRQTWAGSLACLEPRGWMVCFGNSSGVVPPLSINTLRDFGSIRLTWTRLGDYTATTEELDACAAAFLDVLARGVVRPRVHRTFRLHEAADAHRMMEARATNGSLVLVP